MENSKQQRQLQTEGALDQDTHKLKSEIEALEIVKAKLQGTIIVASGKNK